MTDFASNVKEKTSSLSIKHLVLFCALNCEKLLPSYVAFSNSEEWGDAEFFKKTLTNVYDLLVSENEDFDNLVAFEDLEENSPDLDEFDSNIASYAFDTCCAFDELFQFLSTSEIEHVLNNSQHCVNTVDMFIQQKEGIDHTSFDDIQDLETLIAQDHYMLREHKRQLTLLDEINKVIAINIENIESIRSINLNFGSMIDYSLL